MKLSYYPGCSLTGSSAEYDESIRDVASLLGIELQEIEDWNCCGASSAHMTGHDLAISLARRNLEIARKNGLDLLVPCAACFQRLRVAEMELRQGGERSAAVSFEVLHLSTLLSRPEHLRKIRESLVRPLNGLQVACYYGCLALRPPAVTGAKEHENPRGLDLIVEAAGAAPVRWSYRTECCGGGLAVARPDISRALTGEIVKAARRAGAKAIVVDCPLCQVNLESRQEAEPEGDRLVVFFATELISLAAGREGAARRLKKHLVDARLALGETGL